MDLSAVKRARLSRTRTWFAGALGWTARAITGIVGEFKRFTVIGETEYDPVGAYTGAKDDLKVFADFC